MMIGGWLSNLLPSLLIGLLVGGVATWQVESTIDRQFERARLNSATDRQRLITDISTASAQRLEDRLKELRADETRVGTHFTREIIKPVFSNVCASDEYVRLFNETSDAAARTLSGSAYPDVPGKPAASER